MPPSCVSTICTDNSVARSLCNSRASCFGSRLIEAFDDVNVEPAALLLLIAGSESIMKAITEKMRELARKKEEEQLQQQQQQARDSDTMSTIAVTPFSADLAPLNRFHYAFY